MNQNNEAERLRAQGLDVETVGNILDPEYGKPADPVEPPRLADQPAFPAPGIYFGMPEDQYHAIHAGSTSGLKRLSVSSMDYWANSTLNPEKEEDDAAHLSLGKAYHKRIVEGPDAYDACYAIELDKADFVDAEGKSILLTTTEQIKYRIAQLGHKPTAKGYDDLSRAAKKEDWIAQLLDLDPEAPIWDAMVERHRAANEGKVFISAHQDKRIQIAARMIEAHPELGTIFTNGHAEVSIFWYCPATGCPMKMRADYLKLSAAIDLKSFGNKGGMPIDRAIEKTIANYRYNLQHVIYDEGIAQAKAMIREHGVSAIHVNEADPWIDANRCIEWAMKWAKRPEPPIFLFVFQQTGNAPVTRGKKMPRSMVFSVTRSAAERLKRRWVECAQTYGVDPWLDIAPIEDIDDEAIPLYATEF